MAHRLGAEMAPHVRRMEEAERRREERQRAAAAAAAAAAASSSPTSDSPSSSSAGAKSPRLTWTEGRAQHGHQGRQGEKKR